MPAMHIKISKANLIKGLGPACAAVIGAKTNPPILAYILIDALGPASLGPSAVRFHGGDLQTTMTMQVDGTVIAEGQLAMSAASLQKIAATMPDGEIEMKALDGSWLQIKSLVTRAKVEFKLPGMHARDFYEVTAPPTETPARAAEAGVLLALMKSTLYAMSKEENRANLHCLHIDCTGKRVAMVATDGHRLAHAEAILAFPDIDRGRLGYNLPTRGARQLAAFLEGFVDSDSEGKVLITASHTKICIRAGGLLCVMKPIDVVFPPWQQIVPAATSRRCTVPKGELLSTIDRAVAMAYQKTHSTFFHFEPHGDGEITLSVDNSDMGTMRDTLTDKVTMTGDKVAALFNAEYIKAAVECMPGNRIVFRLNEGLETVVIESIDNPASDAGLTVMALVMPMKS